MYHDPPSAYHIITLVQAGTVDRFIGCSRVVPGEPHQRRIEAS
jgi:hypothetical protein